MQAFSYFKNPPNIVKTLIEMRPSEAGVVYDEIRTFLFGSRTRKNVTIYSVETHPEYHELKSKGQLLDLIARENSDPRNKLNIKDRVLKMWSHMTFRLDKFESALKPNV